MKLISSFPRFPFPCLRLRPGSVGRGGFEPPKRSATDLQSVPFGHSGISPRAFARLFLSQTKYYSVENRASTE